MESEFESALRIINDAKINTKNIKAEIQQLHINIENTANKKQFLLEVDDHILEGIENNEVNFKAINLNDTAVLCTHDKIFEVKSVDSSNSLLMIPNLKFSDVVNTNIQGISNIDVINIFHNNLELRQTTPKFENLINILNSNKYMGPEYECDIDEKKLYNFTQLLEMTKASKNHVKHLLNEIFAIEIQSKYRLLDQKYHFKVVEFMLKVIDENSWNINEIRKQETVDVLSDLFPKEIISRLFDLYTIKTEIIEEIQLYKYDEEKIVRIFAFCILNDNKMNFKEFFTILSSLMPESFKISKEMLYGVTVIDEETDTVWILDRIHLPDDIYDRFKLLFNEKPKWAYSEIVPYLKCLGGSNTDVNLLLMKHTRMSTVNTKRYFSKKY